MFSSRAYALYKTLPTNDIMDWNWAKWQLLERREAVRKAAAEAEKKAKEEADLAAMQARIREEARRELIAEMNAAAAANPAMDADL